MRNHAGQYNRACVHGGSWCIIVSLASGRCGLSLKLLFQNTWHGLSSWAIFVKFLSGDYHIIPLMIRLVANRNPKFESKSYNFHSMKYIWKWRPENGRLFCLGPNVLINVTPLVKQGCISDLCRQWLVFCLEWDHYHRGNFKISTCFCH